MAQRKIVREITSTIVTYVVAGKDKQGKATLSEEATIRLDGKRAEEVAQNIVKRDIDKKAIVLSAVVEKKKYGITMDKFLEHAEEVTEDESEEADGAETTN